MAEHESPNPFSTWIAVLIAIVSIVGALIAYWVTIASSDAGSADTQGLLYAVDREDVTTEAAITVNGHLTAYVSYTRNRALADAYDEFARDNPNRPEFKAFSDAFDLAAKRAQDFIPTAFLTRDQQLDQKRDLGANIAQSSTNKQINPQPAFEQADQSRNKAMWLLVMLILMGMSLLFFTLADAIRNPVRYLFLMAGIGTFGTGALGAILIQLMGAPTINITITL